jgi:hypothetical protein
MRATNIVLDVVLDRKMRVLNNYSLKELIRYGPEEHSKVLAIEEELTRPKPKLPKDARPRMVLAASRYAFERDSEKADLIHENAIKGIHNTSANVRREKRAKKRK